MNSSWTVLIGFCDLLIFMTVEPFPNYTLTYHIAVQVLLLIKFLDYLILVPWWSVVVTTFNNACIRFTVVSDWACDNSKIF